MANIAWDTWLGQVNRLLMQAHSLTSRDYPAFDFRTEYLDGCNPIECVLDVALCEARAREAIAIGCREVAEARVRDAHRRGG
jgi:hypothetical protein